MDAKPIKAIKDIIRKTYPDDGTVTGYKYEPQYCGTYEGKLVFHLDYMLPKKFPDSPMYVGYPNFALVDPENTAQFEVILDDDLKLFSLFQDKIQDASR